jgi:hypothetical protein
MTELCPNDIITLIDELRHKRIKPLQLNHQPRRPRHHCLCPRHHHLCPYRQSLSAIAHCIRHLQSHSKRPTGWLKRLGKLRSQASNSLSSLLECFPEKQRKAFEISSLKTVSFPGCAQQVHPCSQRRGPVLGGPLVYVAGTFSKWTSLTQTFLLLRGRSPHYFYSNSCQKS